MSIWHGEKGKKPTGGKIHLSIKKRKYELGSLPIHTKLGKEKKVSERRKGGLFKLRLFSAEFANVLDKKNKSVKRVKILDVVENPANPHYIRRKIITKGTVIKTEIGNARVTSRPSQHGIINAILLEK